MLGRILRQLITKSLRPSPSKMGFAEGQKNVLHVGCGTYHPNKLPQNEFSPTEWKEVRLDIDPGVCPDVIASITEMPMIPDESCDAVYSSHNLEHLYAYQVPIALAEFMRVLKPGGFVLFFVPDMQVVAEWVAQDRLEDIAYISPMGPITPLDIMYGLGTDLAKGNHYMAHRSGFTASTLRRKLDDSGFVNVDVKRDATGFGLRAIGYRREPVALGTTHD